MVKDRCDYLRRRYAIMVNWVLGLNWYLHEVFCWSMQMDVYIVTVPGRVNTVLCLKRLCLIPKESCPRTA